MPFFLKTILKKFLDNAIRLVSLPLNIQAKNSPQVQISERALFNFYRHSTSQGYRYPLSDKGFRVYSQFEEDGILLYIFAAIGAENKTFIDIGSGDGINSNCANLAVNFGWSGLFMDGNPANIKKGKEY